MELKVLSGCALVIKESEVELKAFLPCHGPKQAHDDGDDGNGLRCIVSQHQQYRDCKADMEC